MKPSLNHKNILTLSMTSYKNGTIVKGLASKKFRTSDFSGQAVIIAQGRYTTTMIRKYEKQTTWYGMLQFKPSYLSHT